MSNLLDVIRKNIEFVGISLLLMVIVFVIARASEVLIEKRNGCLLYTSPSPRDA